MIATGSRTLDDSIPWKQSSLGYQDTKDKLEQIREQVTAAKSIVVVGGGPTGIETVAELGFEYGKTKEITLVSLSGLSDASVETDEKRQRFPRTSSTTGRSPRAW